MKRFFCLFLTLLALVPFLVQAEPYVEHTSGDLSAAQPTKVEIRDAYYATSTSHSLFSTTPSAKAPYATGALSEEFLQVGLDYLNFVRYVAKLPAVQLDAALNESAQYGAVLMAANNTMSHTPPKPEDMDQEFYEKGYAATSSSNLATLYYTTNFSYNWNALRSSIDMYMQDTGSTANLSSVGHRRWLLNPTLLNVGFGYAVEPRYSIFAYTATKVFDTSGPGCDYNFNSWPTSGNFPMELFSDDASWSVTLNPEKYQIPQREDLTIQITRYSDGKTWVFDANSPSTINSDRGYYLINRVSYGIPNCIVFRPALDYFGEYEGSYWVCISGLTTAEGEDASIYYDVEFFDLDQPDCEVCDYQAVVTEPTCTDGGYTTHTCSVCHHFYKSDWTNSLGHTYEDHLCIRCGEVEDGYFGHGAAGENVTWTLDHAGNLVLSGYGDLYDFTGPEGENPVPWSPYHDWIRTVTLDDGITSLPDYAFDQCRNLTGLVLPADLERIGCRAFGFCEALTELTIPEGVTVLEEDCFIGCNALNTIELPGTLTSVGISCFYGCKTLREVTLPDSVTSIGEYAFSGCAALEKIAIPEGVMSIAPYTFSRCTALAELRLPDALTQICHFAFEGCSNLRALALPENVEKVSAYAFADSGLESIRFHGPCPDYLDPTAFQNVTAQVGYPAGDSTWTLNKQQNYGGTLTWIGEDIPAHNWLPRNCEQVLTCGDCGKTFGQPGSHRFTEYYLAISPTCTTPGAWGSTCDFCGYEKLDEIPPEHQPIWNYTEASCTEPGYFWGECVYCGNIEYSDYTEPLGHDLTTSVTPPTCTQEGYEHQKCSRCDYENTITRPKTGHEILETVTLADCTLGGIHQRNCANCDFTETLPIAPAEHEYYSIQKIDATCVQAGRDYIGCRNCAVTFMNPLDLLEHNYVETMIEPQTCENGGLSIRVCSGCGREITTSTPPLGHVGRTSVLTEPTCTEEGQALFECDRCDYSSLSTLPHSDHIFDYDSETRKPTCTAAGERIGVCVRCGSRESLGILEPLGHRWVSGKCETCGIAQNPEKPELPPVTFVDVVPGSYYEQPVNWAVANGITTGTSATTFSPDDPCTRGQVVTFLWRSAGCPEPESRDNPFTDVTESDYFYKAVLWAVENGITNGMSDTSFAPASPCTRAQVATFLWRSAGKPEAASDAHSFTDIEKDYYYDAVLWAVDRGITNGMTPTTFAPTATCNRAQIVTFLYRSQV